MVSLVVRDRVDGNHQPSITIRVAVIVHSIRTRTITSAEEEINRVTYTSGYQDLRPFFPY